MSGLSDDIDRVAADVGFSGVVRIDRDGRIEVARAYGMAHRGWAIANTVDTRFGLASAVKGMTALTVVSLVEDGTLALSTTARSVLGADLPLIGDDVTVGHLLAHRSGIGDFLEEDDEDDIDDYVLAVPVHELVTTEDFLAVLDGHPTSFAPDERFAYCNGGYVVLALIAERVSGTPFADLVEQRVCAPAGMDDTAFLRSDELPGRTALGYLSIGDRTNVFHLPVRGTGDGGIYSTAADLHRLWVAMFDGAIVADRWVEEMVRPHSDIPSDPRRYGLGFWLAGSGPRVSLEGYDAGVSCRTVHDPTDGLTYTVISNTSDGAWPVARLLADRL